MKQDLTVLQKKIKGDTTFLLVSGIILVFVIGFYVTDIFQYSTMKDSAFAIQQVNTDTGMQNYLYINGEQQYPIDYNYYGRLNEEGSMEIRKLIILDYTINTVRSLLMVIILFILTKIFKDLKAKQSPFYHKNVKRLRMVALVSMLFAVLPATIDFVFSFVIFNFAIFDATSLNFYIIFISVVIGMIAEVFNYGSVLQKDLDQIA